MKVNKEPIKSLLPKAMPGFQSMFTIGRSVKVNAELVFAIPNNRALKTTKTRSQRLMSFLLESF
jgi:hypothetical protein